ncbi:MAG: DUF2147 domain-containing protein [Bacteroidaceae bacterium]|nr:DUF2147 domain-containing protein [Bacteroidaceae bacterium]MBR1801000.1 DUF2147 domain-containing protein [Bacteroidaceae bacterium]
MKKTILTLAVALMTATAYAQDVLGKWITEAGDAHVEIYKAGDKINGKIIWLEQGPDTKDKHNPDAKLKERKLMGVNILSGLTKGKEKWEGGKVYDPKSGKTYKCSIWLDGDKLKVRGYLGVFHDTQTWKRK